MTDATDPLKRFSRQIERAAWFAVEVFAPRVELEDAKQEASLLVLVYADRVKGIRTNALARAERDANSDDERVKAIIGAKLRLDLAQLFGRQEAKDITSASLDELPPDVSSSDKSPEARWISRIDTESYVRNEYPYLYLHAVKQLTLDQLAAVTGEGVATVDRRIAEEKRRAAEDPYFVEQKALLIMTRKYNAKHPDRRRSHYPERLSARGLGKSPSLMAIEGSTGLRAKQTRRLEETGHPWRDLPGLAETSDAA